MKRSVLEYLYEAADVCSEKIALEDTEQAITYGRLLLMVKAAGTFFARLGAGKRPVIVLSQRSADCIAAFLGVAASGNFYVPVDTAIPSGRFRSILDTLNPVCVTGRESCRDIAEKTGQDIPFYSFEEVFAADADEKLLKGIRAAQIDTDPLYAIFTSGSTGMPKGVLVSHRSVIDLAEQFTAVFGFGGDEVFANQAPFDFDVSVKDLYLSLRNKGTLLVVPQTLFIRPKEIVPFLREKGVTVLIWAASALQLLHNFSALDKEVPDTVRQVMFSGEVLPVKVLHYWQEHLPQARFVNLYGPTEITCNCTYYIVDRAFADTEILPVGKPFPNTEILLLDKEGAPVPRGEIGEICVRGSSLALGYYRNPKATQAAFRQNPCNGGYPELLYFTGDLGRYNELGELVFVSRADSQIKHMGHRIELGEIEAVLNSFPYIRKCCCIYHEEKKHIVLFYQTEEACDAKIRAQLLEYLPKYMCPTRMVWMKEMPMNDHGKIHRALLKQQYLEEA